MFCPDILCEIFSFLPFDDVTSVSLSCNDFHLICSSMDLYKELEQFKEEFPICIKANKKYNYCDMVSSNKLVLFRFTYDGAEKDKLFRWLCVNGNLQVCQWLYSLGNVDIHELDDYAFLLACENGHLQLCQWLYSLGNIDIHRDRDQAFRWACQNGNLQVCQWLYSLVNVDIHGCNDLVYENGHSEVCDWLKSLI